MEVGRAAASVYVHSAARSLGFVLFFAFDDAEVRDVLELPPDHEPPALVPVGSTR